MTTADRFEARAALLAALWAQRMGLPAGNGWEPGIVRYMLAEFRRLGADGNAAALVEALTARQLGMAPDQPANRGQR